MKADVDGFDRITQVPAQPTRLIQSKDRLSLDTTDLAKRPFDLPGASEKSVRRKELCDVDASRVLTEGATRCTNCTRTNCQSQATETH
jgi:hypothetical protein